MAKKAETVLKNLQQAQADIHDLTAEAEREHGGQWLARHREVLGMIKATSAKFEQNIANGAPPPKTSG